MNEQVNEAPKGVALVESEGKVFAPTVVSEPKKPEAKEGEGHSEPAAS